MQDTSHCGDWLALLMLYRLIDTEKKLQIFVIHVCRWLPTYGIRPACGVFDTNSVLTIMLFWCFEGNYNRWYGVPTSSVFSSDTQHLPTDRTKYRFLSIMDSLLSYLLLLSLVAPLQGSPTPHPKQLAKRSNIDSTSSSATASSISIVLPSSNYGIVIDQDFPGFGFEEASFVNYAQDLDGNANMFSSNLIEAVTSRTGGKPIIRLGGTSADYAKYIGNQTEPALPLAIDNKDDSVGGTTIGPSFWALASLFPTAQYMVQVPLATTDINETITWVQTALDIIGEDQIYSFELGNEPDWYSETYTGADSIGLGPPDWQGSFTNETYAGNFSEYAQAIVDAVPDLPNGGKVFQAFDAAARITAYSGVLCYQLDVGKCFDSGIDDGGYITTMAHHYYQNAGGGADYLAAGLMVCRSLTY